MNSMWYKCLKAVIWKEFIEGLRTSKFIFLFSILFFVIVQYLNANHIFNNNQLSHAPKELLLELMTIVISIMAIPYFGNTLIYRTIYEERRNKTIHVLFASGVSPTALWMGKFLVATILSYFVYLFSILIFWIFLKIYWGYTIVLTGNLWLMAFFIMPLLSIGILAVLSVSYWYLKNANTISMLFYIITIFLITKIPNNFLYHYDIKLVCIGALIIGTILVGTSFTIIKFVPKERITIF